MAVRGPCLGFRMLNESGEPVRSCDLHGFRVVQLLLLFRVLRLHMCQTFKPQRWVAQDLEVDVHAICCRLCKTLQLPFQSHI